MSTPEKHISRRTAWRWLALSAPLAAGAVWLCARPGGCQIGSHVVTVTTETLGPGHIYYDEPSGFKSSYWDGPTGSFSSGNSYSLKFGHWMLRLDIIEDPIETTRRRLSKRVPNLIAVLDSDDRFERMVALDELGKLGASATPALPASSVALSSLKALGEMGPDAVPALLEILQTNSKLRRLATDALARIGPAATNAITTLSNALNAGDPATISSAAKALGSIGPAALSAAPRLREWLGADVHSGVRASAALALWKMGVRDDAIIQTLMDCLSDEAGRQRAVRALADIGPPAKEAVPASEAARSDRTTSVGHEIEKALARITAPTAEGNAK